MSYAEIARPFLTLHLGQAGVQIGNAIWELLCLEHNIQQCGLAKPDCPSNGFYDAVFLRNQNDHFMPRSIFVDTDPTAIDEIRVGPYRELFSRQQLLSEKCDAGFNYMTGRRGFRQTLLPDAVERFRWMAEKSDVRPTAFLVHGISGGTGSGFATAYLESLNSEIDGRLEVMELNVSSGRSGLQNTCEMINSVLYSYESKDYTSISFSVTNSALFNICRSYLGMAGSATFTHVNRMLAMCFSNLTAMERFPGTISCNISTICSSVLPFKQLKYPILACAPFSADSSLGKDRVSAMGVTSAVMEPDCQLADVDLRLGKHMAGVLIYRGAVTPADIDQALYAMGERGRAQFVDWAPVSFKAGLTELPPLSVPNSGIAGTPLSVTLISNHTAMASLYRGQSDGVKKLVAAGNLFLRSYEATTASSVDTGGQSASAGHNSDGIVGLLKEATDHLDSLVDVYSSEKPPVQETVPNEEAAASSTLRPSMPKSPRPKGMAYGPRSFRNEPSGLMREDEPSHLLNGAPISTLRMPSEPTMETTTEGYIEEGNTQPTEYTGQYETEGEGFVQATYYENQYDQNGEAVGYEMAGATLHPVMQQDSLQMAPASADDSTVTHGQQASYTNESLSTPTAESEAANLTEISLRKRGKPKKQKSGFSCCARKRPDKNSADRRRSLSQNHANSSGAGSSFKLLYSSKSSSQDDILVGTNDCYSYLRCRRSGTHSCAGEWPTKLFLLNGECSEGEELINKSGASNEGTAAKDDRDDYGTDLDEIIRDCQPLPMPSLNSVRMMVQKYNQLQAKEL